MSLDKILLDTDTHDEFLRRMMGSLVGSTRSSNKIPKGLEYNYLNSFSEFRSGRDKVNEDLHQVIQLLLKYCPMAEEHELLSDGMDDPCKSWIPLISC